MEYDVTEAYERILSATGARTQTELAELLEVKQSSISDALSRRNGIPGNWLVTLTEKFALNPRWIKAGQGDQFLQPADGRPLITLKDYSMEALLAELGKHFRLVMNATTGTAE